MDHCIKFLPLSAFAFACAVSAAHAADIEMPLSSSSAFPADISDPSAYLENGAAYAGSIDSGTNLTINFNADTIPAGDIASVSSSVTAGDLTYNMYLPSGFWSKTMLSISANQTLSVGDFFFNMRESATSHPILTFYINPGSTLKVRGNFLYTDTRSSTSWYETRLSIGGSGSANFDGDFTIDRISASASSHTLNAVYCELGVANFTVGGVLTLQNARGDKNILSVSTTASGTFTRTLGGLRVAQNGMILLNGDASSANTTELVFTNSGESEYIGGLLTRETGGTPAANKLNIRMLAESACGRQIMRFADTGGWTLDANAFSDSADALGEVEIGNGRLDMGMRDGMKGGSLFLNGYNGADKAVFSAAGTYSNAEMGKVVFDSMSFYRGTIVFDLAEEKELGDFIQINGAVTKTSESSELSVEINVSAYDLQGWLESSGDDEWSADLLSFATEGSNVSADDFSVKLQDGIIGKIIISELNGISTVSANLSLVPEPSGIAATLGLAALAFAARKRRGK